MDAHYLNKKITGRNPKSMFIKIFLLSISLSFLILLFLGIYNFYFIQKNYTAEIERFEHKKLDETLETLDLFFGEMKKLAVNYTLNPDIFRHVYTPLENVVDVYQDIKKLQDSFASNINSSSYIKNIFVYSEKNNHILDLQRLIPADAYYDRGWMDAYNNMTGNFCIVNTHKVFSSFNQEGAAPANVITLITKFPYIGMGKDGAIVLNLDSTLISDLLKTASSGNHTTLACMTSENGTVISSSDANHLYENISEIIHTSDLSSLQKEGRFSISLNGINNIVYFNTSSINNWKLYYISPESTIFEKSDLAKNIIILICLILFVVILILSLFLSLKVYDPVKKLLLDIKSNVKMNFSNTNDIKILQNGINFLFENKKYLEDQLIQNKLLAKETFLTQLITGDFLSLSEIANKAGYFEINLDFAYFKVAVMKNSDVIRFLSDNEYELKKIGLINIIKTAFETSDIEIQYSTDRNGNPAILMMLGKSRNIQEAEANVEQIFEDIKKGVKKVLNLEFTIGLGRTYGDTLNIGTSYKEAIEALNFRFLKGDHAVINIEEMCSKAKDTIRYPMDEEQKLISLITLNDQEKSLLCLKNMINEVMLYNSKFEHIEICLSNIIGIIQRYIFEFGLSTKEIFGSENQIYATVTQFENIENYIRWVSDKFNKIIEYQLSEKHDLLTDFSSNIKEFIESNYKEELSLQSVADHFNYSPQYFCKIFKEKMGINFLDYLTKIRIEKSKVLLRETEESIEKIAGMVGYNNRFSFIRSFKLYTSYSPAEYRLKCRK